MHAAVPSVYIKASYGFKSQSFTMSRTQRGSRKIVAAAYPASLSSSKRYLLIEEIRLNPSIWCTEMMADDEDWEYLDYRFFRNLGRGHAKMFYEDNMKLYALAKVNLLFLLGAPSEDIPQTERDIIRQWSFVDTH